MISMPNISSDIYYYLHFTAWFMIAFLLHHFIKTYIKPAARTATRPLPSPPSPPALPLIGHLHLVTSVLPTSFQTLANRYGPIMKLRLGASTCVVVSNSRVAKEILKTHELNFSSRPEFGSSKDFLYKDSKFIMAKYGVYWRFMKKLCMTRLLSVPQLDKFIDVRHQEVIKLVESVMTSCREGKCLSLGKKLTTYTSNTICRMAMSTRCSEMENEAAEIDKLVRLCLKLAGKQSSGDIWGPLKCLDFSGTRKRLLAVLKQFDQIIERIIGEHEVNAKNGFVGERKDIMDILLEIYHDPTSEVKLSRNDLKSFFLDIFMAGTDTSSTAMQWTMAELINNPETMKKLRHEINTVVGSNRLVKQSDIENLPYLRAVIKETLRLHASAPLILRECGEDCEINGFLVKSKTRILINVYAVMRDPAEWKDPDDFIPERFLEESDERIGEHQMEYKGQNFRYLPFGSGRRGCPGASLAMLVMHLAIGALVQCFDWKMKEGEKVDLTVGPGFGAEMATPLVCYPTPLSTPFS